MRRGSLRVLLGAAPGVGKTFEMLEEGHRLLAQGADVVIGFVETHGRAATAAQAVGLPAVARRTVRHRDVLLEDLDVDAVLARRPEVALVDELTHTNAPGSRNDKRWQDVEELLDAGIDVITTVNVQHIESLGDVVQRITGVEQREVVPDRIVRAATQIEVVDLHPQSLRDRLSAGQVYPAERIDAALSNYFRLGNLTALRELALLWLADEVDSALQLYRDEHRIDGAWPTRERVVVALTGGPEGETLIRRGMRIASRTAGGELLAVHVSSRDGLLAGNPADLLAQRTLTESLGGTYHAIIGDDVPHALVDFARAANATQIVIGASRRGRFSSLLTGAGIGSTIVRESGDIDVHIVNHSAAGGGRQLPRMRAGALSWKRRLAGFAIALAVGPLLSWAMAGLRDDETLVLNVLAYQMLVIVVALTGGIWPALFTAVLSAVSLDYLFVDPIHTITIANPRHALSLVLYVIGAILVSWVVDSAARLARIARRATSEAELMASAAGSVLRGENATQAIVSRAREAFRAAGARLVGADAVPIATDGEPVRDGGFVSVPVGPTDGPRAALELHGVQIGPAERRLLDVIAVQLDALIEHNELDHLAQRAQALADADSVRSALLSAVSHDLRRPLAAAAAAVGGLHTAGDALSAADRAELVATADESIEALSKLMTDLLDVSRAQAGVLAIALSRVDPEQLILDAAEELALAPDRLEVRGDPDVPAITADPVLLQRVVVNLLANADRFSPAGARIRVTVSGHEGVAQIRIIDSGPGVPAERQREMFAPFQRLGDTDNWSGLGLGLALSRGFTEGMGGRISPEDTPGGGLTMVIELPIADAEGTDETTESTAG